MKKQILFLAMFTMALIFAGNFSVKAQLKPGAPTPRPLDCAVTQGPLNPLLGKTYTYAVSVDATDYITVTYNWYVTDEKTFISNAGADWATALAPGVSPAPFNVIANGGATYGSAGGAGQAQDNIDIVWNTSGTPEDPYFLIVNVVGTGVDVSTGVTCNVHNTKVYKIVPQNQFTLDLANYDLANSTLLGFDATSGLADPLGTCISDIQSITWPSLAGTAANVNEAVYDYGTNTLVWAVTAANWTDEWTPELQLTIAGTAGDISLITGIRWATTPTGTDGGDFDLSTLTQKTNGTYTLALATGESPVTPSNDATPTEVGTEGETVYIIMDLDHTDLASNTFVEGLNDQVFTLGINGTLSNGSEDVHFEDTDGVAGGKADCSEEDGYENDLATSTLKKRPTVTSDTYDDVPALQPVLDPVIE